MMYKKAIVKGDIVDQVGKTALIIVFAATFFGGAVLLDMESSTIADKIITALISTSTVFIALIRDKVNSSLKCIPMTVFTVARMPGLFRSMASYTSNLAMLIVLSMMILSIITCIEMMTVQDETASGYEIDNGGRIRYFLFLLLIMDVGLRMPDIVLYGDKWNAALLLSRCSILLASMILYLPRQGFLNIRRILITAGQFLVISTVTYGAIKLAEKWMGDVYESDALAAIMAVAISGLTMLLCIDSKVVPVIATDEYEYTFGEKMLRILGWNNYSEEMTNLDKYLENASKRDFSNEYAHRFYNDMRYAKDIEFIQQRIRTIQRELSFYPDYSSEQEKKFKVYLEAEGAELLGKLSIIYDFRTGVNSCPIKTLNTDSERWE